MPRRGEPAPVYRLQIREVIMSSKSSVQPVRYAVVGQGYFAQAAVLPAFRRAEGAQLVGLVSDDRDKLAELGDRYQVPLRCGYQDYDALLASGRVDAVY